MNDTLIIKLILLNSYSVSVPGLPYRFVPSSSVTWESVVSCVEESLPTYRAHSKDLVTSDTVYLQERCLIVWEHHALLAHFGMDFLLDSNRQWYGHDACSTCIYSACHYGCLNQLTHSSISLCIDSSASSKSVESWDWGRGSFPSYTSFRVSFSCCHCWVMSWKFTRSIMILSQVYRPC